MITFKQKGDFSKLNRYLEKVKGTNVDSILNKYGKAGVEALRAATPKDSGETADAWYYEINRTSGRLTISFCNSNIQNGALVAILIQYGHGTNNGGWVEGNDYINPAIKPLFEQMAEEAWGEVTKL